MTTTEPYSHATCLPHDGCQYAATNPTTTASQTRGPACSHGYTVYAGKHPNGKPCDDTARRLPVHGDCPYGHTTQQHHTLDGLEAELRNAERENTELRAELAAMAQAALDHRRTASEALNAKYAALGEIARLRAELGHAQDYIAAIAHLDEQRDRARAAYDTRRAADLGSPAARAQDPCDGRVYHGSQPHPCTLPAGHEPPCLAADGTRFDGEGTTD